MAVTYQRPFWPFITHTCISRPVFPIKALLKQLIILDGQYQFSHSGESQGTKMTFIPCSYTKFQHKILQIVLFLTDTLKDKKKKKANWFLFNLSIVPQKDRRISYSLKEVLIVQIYSSPREIASPLVPQHYWLFDCFHCSPTFSFVTIWYTKLKSDFPGTYPAPMLTTAEDIWVLKEE